MAPFGGAKKLFGTNPFTFGAPAGKFPPYILDMATTMVAGNKIEYYMRANKPVPAGYGLDRHGAECIDPVEIMKYGSLMPFGGVKGSGIAGMANILGGILSGGGFAEEVISLCRDVRMPANYGCHINLIHVDSVMDSTRYAERMEQWIEKILGAPPAKGFERVVYPGFIEEEKFQRAQCEGVEIAENIQRQLVEAGGLVGLDMARELR
jgi:LDH2 family malate/lactate/ureidoglycolate dehydrogenase